MPQVNFSLIPQDRTTKNLLVDVLAAMLKQHKQKNTGDSVVSQAAEPPVKPTLPLEAETQENNT